jgi:hypothetical protein
MLNILHKDAKPDSRWKYYAMFLFGKQWKYYELEFTIPSWKTLQTCQDLNFPLFLLQQPHLESW